MCGYGVVMSSCWVISEDVAGRKPSVVDDFWRALSFAHAGATRDIGAHSGLQHSVRHQKLFFGGALSKIHKPTKTNEISQTLSLLHFPEGPRRIPKVPGRVPGRSPKDPEGSQKGSRRRPKAPERVPQKSSKTNLKQEDSTQNLSGPDGSRHSNDQHPKDVNSKNSKSCPVFVREFLSSRRQTPEVWNFCVFTVFEFLSQLPRNSRASRGWKFQFFVFFVFCGLKLLRVCLKASALTGYVGDAQPKTRFWLHFHHFLGDFLLRVPVATFASLAASPPPQHCCNGARSIHSGCVDPAQPLQCIM